MPRRYEANADALIARLDEQTAQLEAELAPIRDKPFIVFHDAYQYFEERFGLSPWARPWSAPTGRPASGASGSSAARCASSGWSACSPSPGTTRALSAHYGRYTGPGRYDRSRKGYHLKAGPEMSLPYSAACCIVQGVSGAALAFGASQFGTQRLVRGRRSPGKIEGERSASNPDVRVVAPPGEPLHQPRHGLCLKRIVPGRAGGPHGVDLLPGQEVP